MNFLIPFQFPYMRLKFCLKKMRLSLRSCFHQVTPPSPKYLNQNPRPIRLDNSDLHIKHIVLKCRQIAKNISNNTSSQVTMH